MLLKAFMALSTILCVTTATFWVRSNHRCDQIGRRTTSLAPAELTHTTVECTSVEGRIILRFETARLTSTDLKHLTPQGRAAVLSPTQTYWRNQEILRPF